MNKLDDWHCYYHFVYWLQQTLLHDGRKATKRGTGSKRAVLLEDLIDKEERGLDIKKN
jgi:hypothetical protein